MLMADIPIPPRYSSAIVMVRLCRYVSALPTRPFLCFTLNPYSSLDPEAVFLRPSTTFITTLSLVTHLNIITGPRRHAELLNYGILTLQKTWQLHIWRLNNLPPPFFNACQPFSLQRMNYETCPSSPQALLTSQTPPHLISILLTPSPLPQTPTPLKPLFLPSPRLIKPLSYHKNPTANRN